MNEASDLALKNLARYIKQNNLEVENLFKDVIINRSAKFDNKKYEIKIIEFNNFFVELRKIDVLPAIEGEDTYKSLKELLSVTEYPNLIIVKKLQKIIAEYITKELKNSNEEFNEDEYDSTPNKES